MEREHPDTEAPDADPAPQELAARLARLREAAPDAPPPAVEARLRASLNARRARRSRTRAALIGGGLLAAAALGLWLRPARNLDQDPGSTLAARPGRAAPAEDRTIPASPRPARFRPLGIAEPAPVFTHSARVELAAETAAHFGWPVAPDVPRARVQAEVLYGEDGVARGLRFLPTSFRSLPLSPEQQGVNP